MKPIIEAIRLANGRPYIVGGYVRDFLLGLSPKDMDIEVYGISYGELANVLGRFGRINLIGKSFGIIKLTLPNGDQFDFSLPRRDNKVGVAHKGFEVIVDHTMTLREAAARRDFTINSIAMDFDSVIYDEFGGTKDLERRILRPTSGAFYEDPLRILRGFQFAARFAMTADSSLSNIPRATYEEYRKLPPSRIWDEFYKWATMGVSYSHSIDYMRATSLLGEYPQLNGADGATIDRVAKRCTDFNIGGYNRAILIFGALCANCESTESVASFLGSINCPQKIVGRVLPLVSHIGAIDCKLSDSSIRKLAENLFPSSIRELLMILPLSETTNYVANRSIELGVYGGPQKPLISGNDLIAIGYEQGPALGLALNLLHKLQLEGAFFNKEDALSILKEISDEDRNGKLC